MLGKLRFFLLRESRTLAVRRAVPSIEAFRKFRIVDNVIGTLMPARLAFRVLPSLPAVDAGAFRIVVVVSASARAADWLLLSEKLFDDFDS